MRVEVEVEVGVGVGVGVGKTMVRRVGQIAFQRSHLTRLLRDCFENYFDTIWFAIFLK